MEEQLTPQQYSSNTGQTDATSGANASSGYGQPPLDNPAQNPYGLPPGQVPYYYATYVKPERTPYSFRTCDAVYACFAFAIGFLCWQWELGSSFGTFLVHFIALIGTAIYLHVRGIRQTPRSLAVFVVSLLSTLPFLLYDRGVTSQLFGINLLLWLFVVFSSFYWVVVSTGNSIENRITGFVLADWQNQTFIVPFSNFLGVFISIKTAAKDTKAGKSFLIGIVGLCIAIPLIIGVTSLLIQSDAGFEKFADDFSKIIGLDSIGEYILKFIIGIPIAMYLFGAVCGNVQKRYTGSVTKEKTEASLAAAHRIPRVALITPLAALCIIYTIYIIVMSVYLFSAFAGILPEGFDTYAEYARRGFFELCGVAAINLFILAFIYMFAKRNIGEYPKTLRIFTGILCIMTELLVVTAVSRMLLYVDVYGLSRLRIYTLWFLILLFVIFAILVIWHLRPYIRDKTGIKPLGAGRSIVLVSVCLILALFLTNTDGLIAKYNVWQYESGKTSSVDTEMLSTMSDAVLPYLTDLKENAQDQKIQADAKQALDEIYDRHLYGTGMFPQPKDSFRDWSVQSAIYSKYLPKI